MSIDFLRITPEEAVKSLRKLIESRYSTLNSIRSEYKSVDRSALSAHMNDWQTRVSKWQNDCESSNPQKSLDRLALILTEC